MKNLFHKTLLISAILSSMTALQAQPLLGRFIRTAAPITLGSAAGYHVTNELTNTLSEKQYSTTAELTTFAALGAMLTARTGTVLGFQAQMMNACMSQPVAADSRTLTMNQNIGTLARSMRLGSRAMIATSLATLAYPTIEKAYNDLFVDQK